MGKLNAVGRALRTQSTEDAIRTIAAQSGGEVSRREIIRRLGQRNDVAASLDRMCRRGEIEINGRRTPLNRVNWIVRIVEKTPKKGARK